MTNDEKQKWKDKHGKSVGDSLREYALEYVGKPIDNMLKYVCLHKNSFRRQMWGQIQTEIKDPGLSCDRRIWVQFPQWAMQEDPTPLTIQ